MIVNVPAAAEQRVLRDRLAFLLRQARNSANLTQKQLRLRLKRKKILTGASESQISRIENSELEPQENIVRAILEITSAEQPLVDEVDVLLERLAVLDEVIRLGLPEAPPSDHPLIADRVRRLSPPAETNPPDPESPSHQPLERPASDCATPAEQIVALPADSGGATGTTRASSPNATTELDAPSPAHRHRPRGRTSVAASVAGTAVILLAITMLLSGDDPGQRGTKSAQATTAPSSGSPRQPKSPCKPPANKNVPETKPVPGEPVNAVAVGAAGSMQFLLEPRQIVIYDRRPDACAIIVRLRVDGTEIAPVANATGQTGKLVDGVPRPPKTVHLPWLQPDMTVEVRLCLGDTDGGVFTYSEQDCAPWVRVN